MKTRMIKTIVASLLPAAMLALSSCSTNNSNPSNAADDGRAGVIINTVTGTATVQSIDAATRTVVLSHPDGSTTTYECGPEVRNFDQIKTGDQVTATASEELALVLVNGGLAPAAGTATAVLRTPLGDKPGGRIIHTIGFTAKVLSVDAADRKVTLQLADGTSKTIKVGPAINLDNVQPGNDVGVRMTQAIAIQVEESGQNK